MLNKVLAFIRRQNMIVAGDTVTCAVSGGADSIALVYAMYLLRDKLKIHLEAIHYNHGLRGEESDRDAAFVESFCNRYDIPVRIVRGQVIPGKKGLEAAARDARYESFAGCRGKVATAHTADDNAETVLMHMVRGTGLKGLGGITPLRGNIIRPMLTVTRQEVLAFLEENFLTHVEDSSNAADDFLRNRVRHHVMPRLNEENPRLAENLSALALRLRQDEDCLTQLAARTDPTDVEGLKKLHPAVRSRVLERFLKESGVREPEASHIALAEGLVFSEKPSAFARFPGGVTIGRNYGKLEVRQEREKLLPTVLPVPGSIIWGDYRITAAKGTGKGSPLWPRGAITIRARESGDKIRTPGGTKSLKKLFIECKIPAANRDRIPVICDEEGILGVWEVGTNRDRDFDGNGPVWIEAEKL